MADEKVDDSNAAEAPARGAWPKVVLFDLDGTLVDSAPDIHEALNDTMRELGQPTFSYEAVTRMIGGGVPKLIDRAFAANGRAGEVRLRNEAVACFLAHYQPRATRLTVAKPGAFEILRELSETGRRIGVVTNKPASATREILSHFGLLSLTHVVVGGDAGPPVKPAPDLLLLACAQLGLKAGDAIFVGDSENDVGAAKAAHMPVIALRGGYTLHAAEDLKADAVVDRLGDITAHLPELERLRPR